MSLSAVVLAAGKGTRMKSELPKPLHPIAGRPMLAWVIDAADGALPGEIVLVVGHGRELVSDAVASHFPHRRFVEAEQVTQRGTGDAAAVGLAALDAADGGYDDEDDVLVLPGDTPMLRPETIHAVVTAHRESGAAATLVTTRLDNPFGYGRIQRTSSGGIDSIVEERDCTDTQRLIDEVNAGIYCFRRSLLAPALRMISTDNAQGELYLTDAIGVLTTSGHPVQPFVADAHEIAGVNDRAQLASAAAALQHRIQHDHLVAGVTIERPSATQIDATVVIGADATIRAGSVLEGATTIGEGAVVGPNTHLCDAEIGEAAIVPTSVVVGASVAAGERLDPGTVRSA